MTSIENEVDDFYERASWPLGTRVRIIGGDKGLVGSLVRRCARNWVDRNRKLPMVRWDGKIDAVEVSWDCLKRVVGDEGDGNTEILHEVYVVAPDDRTSEPPAVFKYMLDAYIHERTKTVADAECSCPSTGVCWHILVALTYANNDGYRLEV